MEPYQYDVFISYRRKGGSEKAQLVKSEIKQRGIEEERIFLDTHSLYDGDFEQKIKVAIEQSKSVVVIISNGCFDELKNTDYWYMEIKEAIAQSKQVVPVFFDGISSFASINVPEELEALSRMNAVTYHHEYADAAFDKLLSFVGYQKDNHNLSNRKGCLFSFKYKGCLMSVTLIGLLFFVIIPITLTQFGSAGTSNGHSADNSPVYDKNESSVPNLSTPEVKPGVASPNVRAEGDELLGFWYEMENTSENRRLFLGPDVITLTELNNEGDKFNYVGNYSIKGDSVFFDWNREEKSAKYKLQGNKLTLKFDNGRDCLFIRK